MDSRQISKYEYTHVIGLRSEQLARGSPMYVDASDILGEMDGTNNVSANDIFYRIAERELQQGKLPLMVVRQQNNGTKQVVKLSSSSSSS